jgi:hypothetical protein
VRDRELDSSSDKSAFPIVNLITRRDAVMIFASLNESKLGLQGFTGQMNPMHKASFMESMV